MSKPTIKARSNKGITDNKVDTSRKVVGATVNGRIGKVNGKSVNLTKTSGVAAQYWNARMGKKMGTGKGSC
jgi:hypothetical protein